MKIGDKVIITEILTIDPKNDKYINKVAEIVEINKYTRIGFPFRVFIDNGHFWVEAIQYSPLMMELV